MYLTSFVRSFYNRLLSFSTNILRPTVDVGNVTGLSISFSVFRHSLSVPLVSTVTSPDETFPRVDIPDTLNEVVLIDSQTVVVLFWNFFS